MLRNQLFEKAEKNYLKMLAEMETFFSRDTDIIQTYEQVIVMIDGYIRQLKEMVVNYEFQTAAEEIHFFKRIKPKYIAEFIFYAELLSIEISKPRTDSKALKKYYENVLARIDRFNNENQDFIKYIKRNAEYLDISYFSRKRYDLKLHINEHLHSLDESFSTFQDNTLSKILANEKLNLYIREKLIKLSQNNAGNRSTLEKAKWRASKVSLIELIYSLHISGSIHTANGNLSDLISFTEKIMNINLDNFHKILGEIKNRKIDRTKFLSRLKDILDQHFADQDSI